MKININDKVLIASDDVLFVPYKGKVATVKRIYAEVTPPIAYVEIEDPSVASTVGFKVSLSDLVVIPGEPKSEIPEGAREITREDFDAAIKTVVLPSNHPAGIIESNPMASFVGGMVGSIVGKKIASELFDDRDVITITEDQLVAKIWDGCNPIKMSEIVGGKKSANDCKIISLSAMMTLQNVPEVFFGESKK